MAICCFICWSLRDRRFQSRAAENIRREALKSGSDDVVRQAHQLARSMEKAALYLDSHTFDQISTDATEVVKANPWESLGIGGGVIAILLVIGCVYFRRVEDSFADVI